jgi:hypothetical protein
MPIYEILQYVGPALIYAAVTAALLWVGLRLLRGAQAVGDALALWPVLFFLTLTQHPFPDPAALDCSADGVAPILKPFATVDHLQRLAARGGGGALWLGDKVVQAAMMNFTLCVLIGVALTRFLRHPAAALLSGFALSLTAELSQLTGLFGLYPCAYRYFETDDLILNSLGVLVGFVLWRRLRKRIKKSRTT